MKLVSTCRTLHRYVGIAAGAVLCVLGLSGSVLVFRPELDRRMRPDLFTVPAVGTPAALTDLQAAAAAAVPSLQLYRVRLPRDAGSSCEFIFGTHGRLTTRLYIDPYSRRVLGIRTAGSDFFLWLQSLHFDLLTAETGRQINGVFAMTLVVLGLSGLLLWLRSTASWTARVWPRWGARSARRHWGLHITAGFWGSPFLLLMSTTALYFAFHEPVAKIVYALTLSVAPASVPQVQSPPGAVSLDALLQQARSLEPTGEFTLIRLPRSLGQPATLNYVLPGDWSDLGANGIHFDPNSGAALRIDRVRDMQLGARIVSAFVPLHFGTFGRTPTRVLWALFGALPSVLFTTGLAIWWRRTTRRSRPEGTSSEQSRFEFVTKDSRS